MGFLDKKRLLITGLLSNRSIAYGIAKACQQQGAELAFTYAGERVKERVIELAKDFDVSLVMPCDVTRDEEIASTFDRLQKEWDHLDGVVHAIAYAQKEAISGDFLQGITRENFLEAQNISAYSLAALAKAARPLLKNRKSAVLALSYLGAVRAVPNYNTMGLAKASLEAAIRYLAANLGPEGIRVNGISAGPIKTLAAAGIASFSKILNHVAAEAPLRRNVTIEEVGNVAAFLLSDLASAITGEITYVDCGYSVVATGLHESSPA